MAVVTLLCICLVRNLSVERVSKKQLILETAVGGMNHFFEEIIGKEGKRYIPYLMSAYHRTDQHLGDIYQAIIIMYASFRKCFRIICSNGTD